MMAHWAEINKSGKVLRVVVGSNDEPDEGYSWIVENLGGTWVQTSYNGTIRKNFAGVGFTYDKTRDAFIPPKPFASWILNDETCLWEPPIPFPTDGNRYEWDEQSTSWAMIEKRETE